MNRRPLHISATMLKAEIKRRIKTERRERRQPHNIPIGTGYYIDERGRYVRAYPTIRQDRRVRINESPLPINNEGKPMRFDQKALTKRDERYAQVLRRKYIQEKRSKAKLKRMAGDTEDLCGVVATPSRKSISRVMGRVKRKRKTLKVMKGYNERGVRTGTGPHKDSYMRRVLRRKKGMRGGPYPECPPPKRRVKKTSIRQDDIRKGYEERGVRTGTGPYRDSAQRSISNRGLRGGPYPGRPYAEYPVQRRRQRTPRQILYGAGVGAGVGALALGYGKGLLRQRRLRRILGRARRKAHSQNLRRQLSDLETRYTKMKAAVQQKKLYRQGHELISEAQRRARQARS